MSQTVSNQGNAQLFINTDVSKILLGDNQTDKGLITNSTYDPVTLAAGTVLGRIANTDFVIPSESDASDGSEIVKGILMQDIIIEGGESINAPICVAGKVNESKLVFAKVGDSLETVISGRRYKDKIEGETVGIKLIQSTDLTAFDNS